MNENFGIMDQAYFTPKGEILSWINDLLQTNVSKIEALGAGNIYCQILDSMDKDNKVPVHKVNFKAKLEYEFLQNLKILQSSFSKFGIKRHIEVEKLSKCKYQDNLEFIQWMKRFFDCNGGNIQDYDPVARRKGQDIDVLFANKTVQPKIFIPTQQAAKENKNSSNQPQQQQQKRASLKDQQEQQQQKQKVPSSNNALPKSSNNNMKNSNNAKNNSNSSNNNNQDLQFQQKLVQELQAENSHSNNKLQQIRAMVLNTQVDDSEKIAQIANLLGVSNLIQAAQQQQMQLQQQQQALLDKQRQHEEYQKQMQLQQQMEQFNLQQQQQQQQQFDQNLHQDGEEEDIM